VSEPHQAEDDSTAFDDYQLDPNTVTQLGFLICGDERAYYREGWKLPEFLRRAGWDEVPDHDGSYRHPWITDQLMRRRTERGALAQVVRRLADSREYLDHPASHAEAVAELNSLLKHEGFAVKLRSGRPDIVAADSAEAARDELVPEELHTTLAEIVQDTDRAAALQRRLDEARICSAHGAHLSAVIMMGSLLEGVLEEVFRQRTSTRPQDNLQQLIAIAHEHGWIDADVQRFSQELRHYRNLVHTDAERRMGHSPDGDTSRVCWAVVVAALNDLAASALDATSL
jgi:hypothetical protein